jgi:hypothetical protein
VRISHCFPGGCRNGPAGTAGWLSVADSIALWLIAAAVVAMAVLVLTRRVRRGGPGPSRWTGPGSVSGRPGPAGGPRPGAGFGPGPDPTAPGFGAWPYPQAEQTLADRFARGEISAEAFYRQLSVLRGAAPSEPSGAAASPAGPGAPDGPSGPGDPARPV